MVENFTNFQRRMWYTLARCGITRYYIDITPKGRYCIKKLKFLEALFWVLWTNTAFKFVYHVLSYHGLLGVEVHFLDQMSIWDWLLMYFHVFIECSVWFFKYPMWENLYRQWELQEDIFRKLGRPAETARKITATDSLNFVLYGGVCLIGTFALAVQFFETPKYALNTYAIIPADNLLLRIIFCMHECLFMCPGYAYQAFTMVLAQSYSVSYQHLLEEMNKALKYFNRSGACRTLKQTLIIKQKTPASHSSDLKNASKTKWGKLRAGKLRVLAPGTQYDVRSLVEDYKKIMISAQFHNQWIGAIMGVPEGLNYAQFVSDVFMMIQLLKEESEPDYLAVFFYIMDAVFGMIMLFRMLIILARLYPEAENFIDELKYYASKNTPLRKELLKTIPTLRKVSAKLSGYTVRPESVPIGVNVLINWYITAAMWQRPKGQKT